VDDSNTAAVKNGLLKELCEELREEIRESAHQESSNRKSLLVPGLTGVGDKYRN
jgi:hypothetical protein